MNKIFPIFAALLLGCSTSKTDFAKNIDEESKEIISSHILNSIQEKEVEIVMYGKLVNDTNYLDLKEYDRVLYDSIQIQDAIENNKFSEALAAMGNKSIKRVNVDSLRMVFNGNLRSLNAGHVGYARYAKFKYTNSGGSIIEKTLYFRLDTLLKIMRVDPEYIYNEYEQAKLRVSNVAL